MAFAASSAPCGLPLRGLLAAACATLLALCAARPLVASAHHVRVRPSAATAIPRVTSPHRDPWTASSSGTLDASLRRPRARAGPVLHVADGLEQVTTLPVLSLTAIALSIVAIAGSLFRDRAPSPATPPASAAPVIPVEPERVPQGPATAMDEVALALKADQARRKDFTPKQVILELQRGNARFWSGTPQRPEVNAMERRALIIAQAPTVCILSCADSRVPVEILFDQGLGSVFVVRVAGNILDPTAMGSIEFSVKYLGVKAVLVMGHEACGAVKGAMSLSENDLAKQPKYLQKVLKTIKDNLDVSRLNRIQDNRAQDREAVVTNVSAQVKSLQENVLLKERVQNGSLLVCGAFYEITSGIVDFFTLDKNGLVIDV